MDIFSKRYFNINRKLFTFIGMWPQAKTKIFVRAFVMTALIIFAIPLVISAIVHREDTDRLMLSLLFFLTVMATAAKMLGLVITESNLTEMLQGVADNWKVINNENEKNILQEYSEQGRKASLLYCVTLTAASTIVVTAPLGPKILDVINPLAKPRPNFYFLAGEFFVNRDAHFVKLFFWDAATVILLILITTAVDTMYIVCTQHGCALYAMVRYRLSKLTHPMHDDSAMVHGDSYEWLIGTIKLHEKALTFTSKLNDSYSTSLLLILVLNLLVIPLNGCAIIANLDNPLKALPYGFMLIALSLHLLVLFWPGQRILDHGHDLCDHAYYNQWYTVPIRTRKLLLIFMLRCSQPASISASGLVLMNFENYSTIMRTAISYITVAASFR